ncbi:hypothetical protein DL240_02350 [Lujinxingia litoralis]|uniref:Uncharacterized protein n=1 Tax=Lujinxingia litoralis TaxID=2211119 RepID=A0A328CBN7_9DELT|nr:hypothetical protein [Lujinxingia litoralis]RAL25076.1 hypothetical protein DL240_02350 [Lujinxingia litoralis]
MMMPRLSAPRQGAALLVAMTLALGLGACKSSPQVEETSVQVQNRPLAAEDLLQTTDTLVAAKIRFGGDLPDVLLPLVDDANTELVVRLLRDPITTIHEETGARVDLSALDTERPLYFSISSLGNEAFLKAAVLGLPARDEEWPAFTLYRLLVPTDDPALMSQQLFTAIQDINDSSRGPDTAALTFEGPDFVRLEVAVPTNAHHIDKENSAAQALTWLQSINLKDLAPPSPGLYRATAAYNAFVQAESEFAAWARLESIPMLGALEASMSPEVNRAFTTDDPGAGARQRLQNISRLATISALTDPVAAENEDISLHLDAAENNEVFVDAVLTRTSQGARVYQATDAPITLPALAANAFLSVDWSMNLAALADTVIAPFWELQSTESTAPTLENLGGNPAGLDPSRSNLVTSAVVVAQYPMALAKTSSETLSGFAPLPRALSLRAFSVPANQTFPLGVAGALIFDKRPGVRDQLQGLLSMAQSMSPQTLDAALIDRDDDLLEVRLAIGTTVSAAFANATDQQASALDVELDLNKLGELRAFIPPSELFGFLQRVTLASHNEDAYHSHRIALNTHGATEPLQAAHDAPLLTAPTFRCRTELAHAGFVHLEDLSTAAEARVDAYLDTFSERAAPCIEPTNPYAPQAAARLELVRQWAAELN